MKIVFLIGNYVPHQVLTFKYLINVYHFEIHSISVSQKFKYIPEGIDGLYHSNLSDYKKEELLDKIINLKPKMLVVAGWMISDYVWVSKKIKKHSVIPIVGYSDTQWYGTIRQKVNAFLSPFHLKKAFSYLWVSGVYQYEYARRLGFDKQKILFNSLSADVDLFNKISIDKKKEFYPKNFLYIGRFVEVKGIDFLVKAWDAIENKNGWTLTLVGDGPLKNNFTNKENIIVKDFMSQEELMNEMQNSGCFILPSIKEPWALVIHEAAAAGLPIVCTNICGAAPHFVIDNHNGFKVNPESVDEINDSLVKIIGSDTNTLIKYSENSKLLSRSITPTKLIDSLMQVLKNETIT